MSVNKLSNITQKEAASLTDSPSQAHPSVLGWSSLFYRNSNNPQRDHLRGVVYVLNAGGDGWYRGNDPRLHTQVGLSLVSLKITSKDPVQWPQGRLYKCRVNHIETDGDFNKPIEQQEYETSDPMWLYVANEFELEDVLKYINQNSKKWRP